MQLAPITVLISRSTQGHDAPETKGHLGMTASIILASVVTITLTIRLYTRKWLTRGFGLDDIFIILAYFPSTAYTLVGIITEKNLRWDHHNRGREPNLSTYSLQIIFANQILFELATSLTKLSILILLYRLTTAASGRNVTIAVLISIGTIGIDCFIFIFVSFLQCIPLSAYWDHSIQPQHCIDWAAHILAASIINTITDWVVVLLPIWVALRLNLPIRQVGIVIFLFGLGILASSAGIVRSYYAWILIFHSYDIKSIRDVWLTSIIELNLGIICASIPAMKPFFATYLPGILKSLRQRSSMTVRDRTPLTHSPSFTTFIDQSSPSSSFLLRHLAPLPASHQHVNLNKPLPPIIPPRYADLEMQSEPEAELGTSYRPPQIPPRSYYRADISPSNLLPSDWIFIMYQEGNDLRLLQQIPNRAELA
ncbi:hypothetical protein F4813DRAFT_188086 [Daldinia decipiens]|uniref:uncharacterized protein n=1 Tax=Daldinia decipiens TaxID=326647 RepID=UPI0020C522D9|nr:uncharacterized protein F4813DRAFT_188086 [Daldinia decipiens]KAI1655059.1 hypothetical protein F4813DRAFT_188086 [Daldinia decipiens]